MSIHILLPSNPMEFKKEYKKLFNLYYQRQLSTSIRRFIIWFIFWGWIMYSLPYIIQIITGLHSFTLTWIDESTWGFFTNCMLNFPLFPVLILVIYIYPFRFYFRNNFSAKNYRITEYVFYPEDFCYKFLYHNIQYESALYNYAFPFFEFTKHGLIINMNYGKDLGPVSLIPKVFFSNEDYETLQSWYNNLGEIE